MQKSFRQHPHPTPYHTEVFVQIILTPTINIPSVCENHQFIAFTFSVSFFNASLTIGPCKFRLKWVRCREVHQDWLSKRVKLASGVEQSDLVTGSITR